LLLRALLPWALLPCLVAAAARAQSPSADAAPFLPQLSDAAEATEYWDVAAQFASGHRFFARFIITNEGPGVHTAAAVGHLLMPTGEVARIRYGRTRDDWLLSPDRKRLKIASAVLDLVDPRWRVEVDSDRNGYKVLLQLTRAAAPLSSAPLPGSYWIEVLPPTPVRGTIWLRGMDAPTPVEGTLAMTHTRMERNEADLVRRRAELFAAQGDVGIYLSDLTFANGKRRGALIVRDSERVLYRSDDVPVTLDGAPTPPGDARYPVPAHWLVDTPVARADVHLGREWLRWEPLDIVPQPFRFLLGLRAEPQLVWADAEFTLGLAAGGGGGAPLRAAGRGVALVAFPRPLSAP